MKALQWPRAALRLPDLGAFGHDLTAILAAAGVLTLLMGQGVLTGPLFLLRALLGLAFVIVLPGYCVTSALFPRRADLDLPARIGLSLAISVGLVPPLSLLLDRTPWGIQPWPILGAELIVCLLAGGVAVWRRTTLPPGDAVQPVIDPRPWWGQLLPDRRRRLSLSGGILLLFALAFGALFVMPSAGEQAVEFYMLGPDGKAQGFPRDPVVGEPLEVTIGVVNNGPTVQTYQAEIWAADRWSPARSALLDVSEPFVVPPGARHELPARWAMPWSGSEQQVEFLLLPVDGSTPSRRLLLVLDVAPREPAP